MEIFIVNEQYSDGYSAESITAAVAVFTDEDKAKAYADSRGKAEREFSPYYFTVSGPFSVNPEIE